MEFADEPVMSSPGFISEIRQYQYSASSGEEFIRENC